MILAGMLAGKPRNLVGADARVLDALVRVLDALVRVLGPRYQRLVAQAFARVLTPRRA